VTALRDVNENTEVVTFLETSDGTQSQVRGDDESVGVKQTESLVSISSVGDNTVTAVSKLKNWAGTTEATFKHHVYWEYDGTNVMNESHWHEVSTAVLYDFDGLSTNYLDNRGDEAVSERLPTLARVSVVRVSPSSSEPDLDVRKRRVDGKRAIARLILIASM